jgi:putative hemolysin
MFWMSSKPMNKHNAVAVSDVVHQSHALGFKFYSRSGVSRSTTTVNPVSEIILCKEELSGSPMVKGPAE